MRSFVFLGIAAYALLVALRGDDIPRVLDFALVILAVLYLIERMQELTTPVDSSVPAPPYLGEDLDLPEA